MTEILKLGFERMSKAAYGQLLFRVAAAMKDNEHFPMPWWGDPAKTPTPASIKADAEDLSRLEASAANGGKGAIAAYWARRKETEDELRTLTGFLELRARGNLAMLESTGFELRRPRTRIGGTGRPEAPVEFKVQRTGISGMMVARSRPAKGAGSYLVQLCTGDETVEANWRMVAQSKGCRRIEIAGLTPGTLCKFRMCAIGSKGPGAWAGPVALMAD